jgi:hypothetical protein
MGIYGIPFPLQIVCGMKSKDIRQASHMASMGDWEDWVGGDLKEE